MAAGIRRLLGKHPLCIRTEGDQQVVQPRFGQRIVKPIGMAERLAERLRRPDAIHTAVPPVIAGSCDANLEIGNRAGFVDIVADINRNTGVIYRVIGRHQGKVFQIGAGVHLHFTGGIHISPAGAVHHYGQAVFQRFVFVVHTKRHGAHKIVRLRGCQVIAHKGVYTHAFG